MINILACQRRVAFHRNNPPSPILIQITDKLQKYFKLNYVYRMDLQESICETYVCGNFMTFLVQIVYEPIAFSHQLDVDA